jgi:peptidyl-prolyl cis-trans isomerase SurA
VHVIASAGMRVGAAILLALSVLVVPRVSAREINRVVATVDGDPITALEFHAYLVRLGRPPQPDDVMLEALITEKLLEKEAAAKGVVVSDADVDGYLAEVKARNGMDDATFVTALVQQGLTVEAYRQSVQDELRRAQLINQEIRSHVNVSPEEIQRYYDAQLEDYRIGGGRTVRDIFFPVPAGAGEETTAAVRAQAEEVRAKARSRRAFRKLAEEHSEGPGADQGGLLGTFEKGEMTETLDVVVFSLEPGEVSEVVATPDGFHLLMVDEDVDPSYRPVDEVKDDIRERLYDEALSDRYRDWLVNDLRERHHVEVLN